MRRKPKILLLVPPSFLYPMGAAYVAATLENAGYDYDIYGFFYDDRAWVNSIHMGSDKRNRDNGIRNIEASMSQEALFGLIENEKYDYLLVSGLVGFFRWFYQKLPQAKACNPKCKIIMGGSITKDLPENVIFEKLDVDYILKGEAETNLVELLDLFSQENPSLSQFLKIPGLCWKEGDSTIRRNGTIRLSMEGELLRPAWESFNMSEYVELSNTLLRFNKTFFPILAGRGCPNVCAFCSPSIGNFVPYPVDTIISEMKHWRAKYDFDFFALYSEVAFVDEAFTKDFCRKYKKEIGKPWVGQLRTDVQLSVDAYRLMKDSGCMFVCMGFESSNDRVLGVMNKNTTLSDHMRNMSRAKEAGLNVFGNFMFGHETETAEEIRETFHFLNQYDLIQGPSNGLATIIVYPGTRYYRNAEKNGIVDDSFKFLLSYSMTAGISSADIRENHEANRLNISALSNDEFYNVVCDENIKHRWMYSKKHAVIDVKKTFKLGNEPSFIFEGKCPTCGKALKIAPKTKDNPLNITGLCDSCYYTAIIDVYGFIELESYLKDIKESIAQSNKIVIFGSWIMDLIFCGAISIPYNKIIGWVDPENPEISNNKYFYHLKQRSLTDLKDQAYDTIISLKPRILSTPEIMKKYGLNPNSEIINLFPDMLNLDVLETMEKKIIAVAGKSDSIRKVTECLIKGKSLDTIDNYDNIWDVCKVDTKYDFIIFDKNEFNVDRQEFSENSKYDISEVLYTTFLIEGGYYAIGG